MAQQINLYTPALRTERKHFSAATMTQSLAVLLAAGVAFYAYAAYRTSALEKAAADSARQVKAQGEALASLLKDFSPGGKNKALEEELTRASTRLTQLERLSAALRTGGTGNTDGFSRYLAALARQSLNGVWLTGVSIGGDESQLALSGRVVHADLVPAYVKALSKEEVMHGRRITDLRLSGREENRKLATQAPGAKALEPGSERVRFVEFSLTALKDPAPQSADAASPGAVQATKAADPVAQLTDKAKAQK